MLFSVFVFLSSCHQKEAKTKVNAEEVKDDEIIIIADRLSITKNESFTVVKIINPWQGAETVEFEYVLVERGNEIPPNIADSLSIIYVPLQSIICMSSSHVAMVAALGEENKISGVSGSSFIYNEKVARRIKAGIVKDVGYDAGLNNELIMKIGPELIMNYGIGAESAGYVAKLAEAGIKIMFDADYLEDDPLGKAEWIKLFGALFCKEQLADSIFKSEVEAYESVKKTIDVKISTRPNVMLGLPYKDVWYISPGNSYMSKLISDAGGKYLWEEVVSDVSMPHGLENVFIRAMKADFWLNPGTALSTDDIKAIDYRLATLPCFNNVYNNNLRLNYSGGNDYWEIGAVHPHLILKDIASILHPEIYGGHELLMYRKIN